MDHSPAVPRHMHLAAFVSAGPVSGTNAAILTIAERASDLIRAEGARG